MVPVHLIQFEARPSAASEAFRKVGGAFVSVWIRTDDQAAAVAQAKQEVQDANWEILSVERILCLSESDYSRGDSGYDYYQQAKIDGAVLKFDTYPLSA